MKRRLWIVTDMRVFAQRDYVLRMRLEVTTVLHRINIVDYQIYIARPFIKVASYVQKNKHLPDIPSAAEVAKDGIDLGSMDAKLLGKIEELTLYVIEQNKKIAELEKRLDAQEKND